MNVAILLNQKKTMFYEILHECVFVYCSFSKIFGTEFWCAHLCYISSTIVGLRSAVLCCLKSH